MPGTASSATDRQVLQRVHRDIRQAFLDRAIHRVGEQAFAPDVGQQAGAALIAFALDPVVPYFDGWVLLAQRPQRPVRLECAPSGFYATRSRWVGGFFSKVRPETLANSRRVRGGERMKGHAASREDIPCCARSTITPAGVAPSGLLCAWGDPV